MLNSPDVILTVTTEQSYLKTSFIALHTSSPFMSASQTAALPSCI